MLNAGDMCPVTSENLPAPSGISLGRPDRRARPGTSGWTWPTDIFHAGSKGQHLPSREIAPEGVFSHGRAPARAKTPESSGGKALEPCHHPAAVLEQDVAPPHGPGFDTFLLGPSLTPRDASRHHCGQILDNVILADINLVLGQSVLERVEPGQCRPDLVERSKINAGAKPSLIPEQAPS